ncbi:MAG: 7-cyano-7-deazaguanine synthase [Syntrophobacteraceae bacterium]
MSPEDRNGLILLSGGIDSSACLEFYIRQRFTVNALFVDYGQIANRREELAASAICAHYQIPLQKITTTGFRQWAGGQIHGRNAFLLYAALMNFPFYSGVIGIGVHCGTEYYDCSKEFIVSTQKSFDFYTDGRVVIGVPLLDWLKPEIWKYCMLSGVPVDLTYSCEMGKDQPCGNCLSCKDLERLHAGER